jgi:hypothetical protein
MERSNLEKYFLSITPMKLMLEEGLLTKPDFIKAESYLADKYCIKKGNLYRLIDLTIPRNRVIDILPAEEVKDEENSYQYKHVTQVRKEK